MKHNKYGESSNLFKLKKWQRNTLLVISIVLAAVLILLLIHVISWFSDRNRRREVIAYSDLEQIYDTSVTPVTNPYPDLSVPTYITKIDDMYFLVDCYHDQIIYHDNLTDPLTDWSVMTDKINKGHTLAGDGLVYLADDTENNRILVFERQDDRRHRSRSTR